MTICFVNLKQINKTKKKHLMAHESLVGFRISTKTLEVYPCLILGLAMQTTTVVSPTGATLLVFVKEDEISRALVILFCCFPLHLLANQIPSLLSSS